MTDGSIPLETLYARFDEFADGTVQANGGWMAHEAVLDRLAANRRLAEDYGWTSCALERVGGMGRLRVFGVPPSEYQRRAIPDWPSVFYSPLVEDERAE